MAKHSPRFVFVVGGVMSSVGKGIVSASLGALLDSRGYSVTVVKADPYINVDAGTMNPTEHGEVFVTVDGDETDQDMGNYERFLNIDLTRRNYMTTGRVYQAVIERERNLDYRGRCVEVVPHIPLEMIRRWDDAASKAKADITIVEIGGTVGEYQNILFLEAVRTMKMQRPGQVQVVLVSYLPIPDTVGEMKTKPTQMASRELNYTGLQADFVVGRASRPLDEPRKLKLASFCNLPPGRAISCPDADSVYEVPLILAKEKFDAKILQAFNMSLGRQNISAWQRLSKNRTAAKKTVRIGVVGKYFGTGAFTLADSYISVIEALKHAAWASHCKVELSWVDAGELENEAKLATLSKFHGILVPGGFGSRGIDGKLNAICYARTKKIPYFGLCYGMQLATIEFARNVCGLKNANSTEIESATPHPVIHANPYQQANVVNKRYGGTMRLGSYPCVLTPGTIAFGAYKSKRINERHRHRYEFNNAYLKRLEAKGLKFSGWSPDKKLAEIVELSTKQHPFFVGVQFHPEFQSRPLAPHPLFMSFIKAASNRSPH
jgi:CTP synthase